MIMCCCFLTQKLELDKCVPSPFCTAVSLFSRLVLHFFISLYKKLKDNVNEFIAFEVAAGQACCNS